MIFDGFFISHLIDELNQNLSRARLERIYQNDDLSFLFVFYTKGERKYLNLSISPQHVGMHLTQKKQLGNITSQFLATLKKHIEGAILEDMVQYQSDRVIILNFTAFDFIDGPIKKQLIFEAMGRHSNLLIIKDDIIIDTLKKMFFEEGRQLLPQAKFEFFPSNKKPFFHIDYLNVHSPKDIVDHYMGVSMPLAKYLFDHQIQLKDIQRHPTKSISANKSYVFDLFDEDSNKKHYQTISDLMDDTLHVKQNIYIKHAQFIDKQIQKYEKKLAVYEQQFEDAKDNLSYRTYGDLIYQSGHPLTDSMSSIEVNGELIALDPTLTLNQNAQKYYKLYQKAKRAIHHIESQMKVTNEVIDVFKEFQTYVSFANEQSIKELEKDLSAYGFKSSKTKTTHKKQQKPNILTLSDQDVNYYIGKNNLQNEYVTHTLAQKEDYWFHVKDAPGAHVVVTTTKLNESILRKACMLAAYFSSQKHSSSIPVDYVQIKYIKKIPGMPSYKVTYKNHQTMYIDIDEEKIQSYLKTV